MTLTGTHWSLNDTHWPLTDTQWVPPGPLPWAPHRAPHSTSLILTNHRPGFSELWACNPASRNVTAVLPKPCFCGFYPEYDSDRSKLVSQMENHMLEISWAKVGERGLCILDVMTAESSSSMLTKFGWFILTGDNSTDSHVFAKFLLAISPQ